MISYGCIYDYIILLVVILKNALSLFISAKYSSNNVLIGII